MGIKSPDHVAKQSTCSLLWPYLNINCQTVTTSWQEFSVPRGDRGSLTKDSTVNHKTKVCTGRLWKQSDDKSQVTAFSHRFAKAACVFFHTAFGPLKNEKRLLAVRKIFHRFHDLLQPEREHRVCDIDISPVLACFSRIQIVI